MNYKEKIFDLYLNIHNKMLSEHGYTIKALYGSKESQHKRYEILLNIFNFNSNFSVLDIGCGLCDFYDFLTQNNYQNFEYTGVDINEKFIDKSKEKYPEITLIQGSVDEVIKSGQRYDYAVASGIYNLGTGKNKTEKFFLEQFLQLYPFINIGFAVNFLSSYSENPDKISIYHDPSDILRQCMINFSKKVVLYHNYLPHDFTVLVRK